MSDNDRQSLIEIMKATDVATLTYRDREGRLVSTPMATQDLDDPGTVWFITEADSDKVSALEADSTVNVAYASDKGWVSLSGTAKVNRDRDKLKELWDPSATAFMSGGPEDANNVLLEIDGDTAQLWESPGKLGMLVTMAKGLAGGDPAQDHESPVVDL